jgi:inner membrane protein
VAQGAEAPLRLAEAEARLEEARACLARLARARLLRRKERTAEAQLVRSPVAGRVVEVKVQDLRPGEVVVEVVISATP